MTTIAATASATTASADPAAARMPVYFLSHGGGPWPYMQGQMRERYAVLEQSLRDIPAQLPAPPKAILVVSGHWEEPELTVSSSPRPGMIYDYYGFPDYLYHISYPAPGSPELAERVRRLLTDAGWPAHSDPERGYDHGTFSMLAPMYPRADVPVVQLSMMADMDPARHIAVGQALAPLRDEGVLILGSGLSYHNLRNWGPGAAAPSAAFDAWLRDVLLDTTPRERRQALTQWEQAPSARVAHPREDHLIPLMVVLGAAGDDPATRIYSEDFMGAIAASSYRFGADRTPSRSDLLAAA
ncbi:dioxygenase [Bordetella genomosp. 8]|uniref:Dioxygenase n=1 Tax=Bordetella genomosp. 8 TaxID=1416806 RepID=A0A1W6YL20_9BORD|nr:class III extradiol ring-cleavage dioxygenase [Bordetella genomosp. 8]ARP81721.1 dioxygenase [Bordetella genomosp. 8]